MSGARGPAALPRLRCQPAPAAAAASAWLSSWVGLHPMLGPHPHSTAIPATRPCSERNRLSGRCDILVATPGRLIDHLENSGLALKLQGIRTLVGGLRARLPGGTLALCIPGQLVHRAQLMFSAHGAWRQARASAGCPALDLTWQLVGHSFGCCAGAG